MATRWLKLALRIGAVLSATLCGCGGESEKADVASEADGATRDAAATDPCRRACDAGQCEETDFAATKAQWVQRCEQADHFWAFVGRCDDNTELLLFGTGTTNEWRHFDSSGTWLGTEESSDAPDANGCRRTYYPNRIACENPVVTAVLCGTRLPLKVGDRLPF